jgi:polar amino acid transport system substrate-binding protein
MLEQAKSDLIDPGCLTVGINLGNILLVTGTGPKGEPQGVAPDMAAALARRLGVAVSYITYATPGEVADAAARDEWDVGLIAIEPERAAVIDFCDAYVEIEATYLVPAGSPLQRVDDVDQAGVRIAVSDRSAYDLFLSRNLKHAELCRAPGLAGAFELFVTENLDALAGLVPALKDNAENLPGSRVLAGSYTSVCQAFGTRPGNTALHDVTQAFIAEAISSGLVAELIEKHGVTGKLQVAGNC